MRHLLEVQPSEEDKLAADKAMKEASSFMDA